MTSPDPATLFELTVALAVAQERIATIEADLAAAKRLLGEWLLLGNLPGGGYDGTLIKRTQVALALRDGEDKDA